MKLKYFCLFFLLITSSGCYSQSTNEPGKHPFQFSGSSFLTTNGISPIPAFSLNKPALMTALSLKKGYFSFDPEFNYALDAKPWTIDTWLHAQIPVAKWVFKSGINLSHFFDTQMVDDGITSYEVVRLNRYFVLKQIIMFKPTETISVNASYWNIKGVDEYAVKQGHFVNVEATMTNIKLFQVITSHFKPMLFFIKNSSPIEGYFASATVEFAYKKIPLFLATQIIQPISVTPATKFNWNTGLKYYF